MWHFSAFVNFSICTGVSCSIGFSFFKMLRGLVVATIKESRNSSTAVCFSVNIAKFLKKLILKKICERLLLNNAMRNYSSKKIRCKIGVKCFSTFIGKHLYGSVLFNKCTCRMELKPIFIQKEAPALVFSWQLSEILTTTFLKREKETLLWEKRRCYKKRGSEIYRKSNYATFF